MIDTVLRTRSAEPDPRAPLDLTQDCAVLVVSGSKGAGESVEVPCGLRRESQRLLLQMINIETALNRGHVVLLSRMASDHIPPILTGG